MAITPVICSAFEVSTRLTMACGRFANSIFIYAWFGLLISPGYKVLPVTLPRASILVADSPIPDIHKPPHVS